LLVPLVIGVALVVFGAFVLIRMPLRPGGTIRTRWFEVSSVGAGLPLIVLGVAAIIISGVDPFSGDDNDETGATGGTAARYFDEFDGDRGSVRFEGDAMYFEAEQEGRPLVNLARGVDVDRFRVRATYVEGAQDHGIGLMCRHEFAGRYYVLAIASDNRYNIVEYEDGKARSLLGGFQHSGAIDRRVNTLEARCEGANPVTLTLLVNGARVRPPVEDLNTPILRGTIGLRVGTLEPPVTVKFEDFELLD
jgi:hypothetical protein